MDASREPGVTPLAALGFLIGCWRGRGTWGAAEFVCRTEGRVLLGRFLELDVRAEVPGGRAHAERLIVHGDATRLTATLYPDRGDVQVFDVHVAGPGAGVRLVFTPPRGSGLAAQRWTLVRTERGYDERYERAGASGAFETSVSCSYEPDDPAAGAAP